MKSYFTSHGDVEKPGRVKRIADWLADPLMWLLFAFLEFALPYLNEFNITFQSGESMIGHLHPETTRLLRKLMGRFVRTAVIREQPDITKVNFTDITNQHEDERLAVGWKTREQLEEVEPDVKKKFLSHVRTFYCQLVETMIAKFPMKDRVLQAVGFLNPETRDNVTPDEVGSLAERFLAADREEVSMVIEEYEDYLLQPVSAFGEPSDPCSKPVNLDVYWQGVAKKKTVATGQQVFGHLCKLARAVLSLPHSNADPERTFSQLRKIQVDSRDNLNLKTIHNLLSIKTNSDIRCCDFKPTSSVLAAARKACSKE